LKFTVLTLFPQLISGFTASGLLRQAIERGLVEVDTLNPRDFTTDIHKTVDDRAFGGSDGMVMKVEPLKAAVESLRAQGPCHVVVLSPQGQRWTQSLAREYAAKSERVVLVCGRYAGIDQRFSSLADAEISMGDFILNGGEVAALAILESIVRLKPGALGNVRSAASDSFSETASGELLECPQFTRPREVLGLKVPAPLLSGNHAEIARFEHTLARVRTAVLRPDLLSPKEIEPQELGLLRALEDSELAAIGLSREQLKGFYP
jgi:tRNA (guanine37-N1)-methyltransferase